ncbi:50S ribosomal protein L23 [Planctomycetales bacterium]|nr:50S ribosomal protein L23 [Planctomycetales bacterium]
MNAQNIIKYPYVSEKATDCTTKHNVYVFVVANDATKDDVRAAVKEMWDVTPVGVRTLYTNPKKRRRGAKVGYTASIKKAFVRLRENETISILK